MDLVGISRELSAKVSALRFSPPVAYVYNPLDYAWTPHERYLRKYGQGRKEVLLLGMNPGPFGMAQTGVPFGEVGLVRDWLGISDEVKKPPHEHPKRPVTGFACHRSEVSGARLWGWAKERFRDPARFFERFFVVNYCPLVFMEESGRNRTPDKLPTEERRRLFDACDEALRQIVVTLAPRVVVGVGAFAERQAAEALDGAVHVGCILHPSPASPKANAGWARIAEAQLADLGVVLQ